ncbi:MAG: hypothetical protein FJ098_17245, partial [Deltaproteobacteria bacterium]|nr:hypothetical protein [Deltaproteobacteria bacterium]
VSSSFLWVAAARRLAVLAESQAEHTIAAPFAARAAEMADEAEAVYAVEGGAYCPYVHEEDLSCAAPAPYEDVNTMPLWTGYQAPSSPAALDNLDATIDALGGGDGILVTPLPDMYVGWMGLPLEKGIYTGMSPGYFLQNLAAARHPLAEAAFNAMALHATPGGTHPEYAVLDGPHPLQLNYEPTGAEPSDYTARYRPWEGAIDADAAVEYLFGLRPDAPGQRLSLAPSLPNGWSWSEARGIRVGASVLDFRVERRGGGLRCVLELLEGPALDVDLELPWTDSGEGAGVTQDAAAWAFEGEVNRYGAGLLRPAPVHLEPGASHVLEARPDPFRRID